MTRKEHDYKIKSEFAIFNLLHIWSLLDKSGINKFQMNYGQKNKIAVPSKRKLIKAENNEKIHI